MLKQFSVRSLAVVTGMTALLGASPASANTTDITCSNGSYNGRLRVYYVPNTPVSGQALVTQVNYLLNPADSSSDQNDVGFSDSGTLPAKVFTTGSGLRDGLLHVLNTQDYYRASGSMSISVDFDRFGTDPHCGASKYVSASS